MVYEMGSSSTNPERHREGQSGSSLPQRIDIFRQMSESGEPREAQVDGCSNGQQGTTTLSGGFPLIRAQFCRIVERIHRIMRLYQQQTQRTNQEISHKTGKDVEKLLKDIQRDLPDGVQQIIGEKAWFMSMVNALAKNLSSVAEYKDYHDRNAAIELIAKEADKSLAPEIVKQLTGCSRDFKLEILSVIRGWGNPSAVPELVKMLKDEHYGYAKLLDYEMYGAIAGLIGKLGGRSELDRVLSSRKPFVDGPARDAISIAKQILENRSGGQELARKLGSDQIEQQEKHGIAGVLGMLGDVSVARELVEMPPRHVSSEIFRAIGEIGKKLDDPEEVKELADKVVEMSSQEIHEWNRHYGMFIAIGKLGQRLVQLGRRKDAKELSKKGVAKLFEERKDGLPFLLDAVFEIEQHLVEPDASKRFLHWKKMNGKVCKAIAEKVVECRMNKKLDGKGKKTDIYNKLVNIIGNEQSPEIHDIIFYVIGEIGKRLEGQDDIKNICQGFITMYHEDQRGFMRMKIIDTIKKVEDKNICQGLITMYHKEQHVLIRRKIIKSIEKVGRRLEGQDDIKNICQGLITMYHKEQSEFLRIDIIEAIGKVGKRLEGQDDINNLCEEIITMAQNEQNKRVSRKMISELVDLLPKIDVNVHGKLISGLVNLLPQRDLMDENVRGKLISGLVDLLPQRDLMDKKVYLKLVSGLFPQMGENVNREVRRKFIEYTV